MPTSPPSLIVLFNKSPELIDRETVRLEKVPFADASERFKRLYFRCVLTRTKGNRTRAAREMRLSRDHVFHYVKNSGLESEFPSSRYWCNTDTLNFSLPKEAFLLFNGTLEQLEDRYVIQVLISFRGNEEETCTALKGVRKKDGYTHKVLNRVKRRPDLDVLIEHVRIEPINFKGTLIALRRHYIMQVLEQCKRDRRAAMKVLGIERRDTFKRMLLVYGLSGRTSSKPPERIA